MEEPAIAERIDTLISDLGGIAKIVERALRAVPRHNFIPSPALAPRNGQLCAIDREADPAGWWAAVYSDTPIVTQLDDGDTAIADVIGVDGTVDPSRDLDYSSSASAPSTVAGLLGWLDPDPGNRVLEVGTGTGWTAALLSHLVGEGGRVTSIEIDPAVAEQAAKNLAATGHQPHLVVGDGAVGHRENGPYDRVHVTCGVRTVPYAWVEQTCTGGTIVLPYCPGFGADHALRLVVMPDGVAHGRFPRGLTGPSLVGPQVRNPRRIRSAGHAGPVPGVGRRVAGDHIGRDGLPHRDTGQGPLRSLGSMARHDEMGNEVGDVLPGRPVAGLRPVDDRHGPRRGDEQVVRADVAVHQRGAVRAAQPSGLQAGQGGQMTAFPVAEVIGGRLRQLRPAAQPLPADGGGEWQIMRRSGGEDLGHRRQGGDREGNVG